MVKLYKYSKKYSYGEKEEYLVQASSEGEALENIKEYISNKGGFSDTISSMYLEEIQFNSYNIIEI